MNSTSPQLQLKGATGPRPLGFGPESLWYLDKLSPGSPVYNVPFLSRLAGKLNVAALRRALDALAERQEVFRSVFLPSQGAPACFVLHRRPVELKEVDLRNFPQHQRESEARALAAAEARRSFNLARDHMLRAFLYRIADEEYLFLFVTHHIIFELGSLAILYRDLSAFYNAFVAGHSVDLPELKVRDHEFTVWQRDTLQSERLDKLKRFWRDQLAGSPRVDLPLDFPRPQKHTHRGERHFFDLCPDLAAASTEFFRKAGTTPYRGLLSAFYIFICCYSGENDLSLGSPFASRCPGIENTIGFFANTLVLRVVVDLKSTFRELIRKVDRIVLRCMANSDLSFEKIVEAVQPPRDTSRTPLFQVSFRGRTQPYAALDLDGIRTQSPEFIDNGTAKFDLAFELESSTGKSCFVEYCSDLLKRETVVQMEADFQRLLRGLIQNPDVMLSSIDEIRALVADASARAIPRVSF